MENKIHTCNICGTEVNMKNIDGKWVPEEICHNCQIEYCLNTNCLGCIIGKYPDCEHLEIKRSLQESEKQ